MAVRGLEAIGREFFCKHGAEALNYSAGFRTACLSLDTRVKRNPSLKARLQSKIEELYGMLAITRVELRTLAYNQWLPTLRSNIDSYSQNPRAKISCRIGCSHCCKQEVTIGLEEARDLASLAQDLNIDFEKLSKQAKFTREEWRTSPEASCVFLNSDGACRVYHHRPLACRTFLVTSPAINCKTGEGIEQFGLPEAEAIITGYYQETKTGSLPEMILREIGGDDELQKMRAKS